MFCPLTAWMFSASTTYLGWLLLAHFGRHWGTPFSLDTSSHTTGPLVQAPLLLSPASLSFLSLLWCADEIVAKGHTIPDFDVYHNANKLVNLNFQQKNYHYPFFLCISYEDLVSVFFDAFLQHWSDLSVSEVHSTIMITEQVIDSSCFVALSDNVCEQARLIRIDSWWLHFFGRFCVFIPDLGSTYDLSDLLTKYWSSWLYWSFSLASSIVPWTVSWVVLGGQDFPYSPVWSSFDLLLFQTLLFLEHYSHTIGTDNDFVSSPYMLEWDFYCDQLRATTDRFLHTFSDWFLAFFQSKLLASVSIRRDLVAIVTQRAAFNPWIGSFPLDPFSMWDVSVGHTLRYVFSYSRYAMKRSILPSFVHGDYSSFCWFKKGGDITDSRAYLTIQNYWYIQHGVGIGVFAPSCYLVLKSNEPRRHLYELFSDLRPVLLMFVGIYPDHDSTLQKQFDALHQQFVRFCQSFLVTNQYDISNYDDDMRILWDYDAEVHKLFHCPVTMLYLIRPDGYVLWRWLYNDHESLISLLSS